MIIINDDDDDGDGEKVSLLSSQPRLSLKMAE